MATAINNRHLTFRQDNSSYRLQPLTAFMGDIRRKHGVKRISTSRSWLGSMTLPSTTNIHTLKAVWTLFQTIL